jgi:hypothetical protein
MYYLLAIVVVIIVIIFMRSRATSESITNVDDLIIQFDRVKKNGGNIFDFRRAMNDSSFPPYKYAQLATLYKQGAMTVNNVTRILASAD